MKTDRQALLKQLPKDNKLSAKANEESIQDQVPLIGSEVFCGPSKFRGEDETRKWEKIAKALHCDQSLSIRKRKVY